jgi:hypothetical protein
MFYFNLNLKSSLSINEPLYLEIYVPIKLAIFSRQPSILDNAHLVLVVYTVHSRQENKTTKNYNLVTLKCTSIYKKKVAYICEHGGEGANHFLCMGLFLLDVRRVVSYSSMLNLTLET